MNNPYPSILTDSAIAKAFYAGGHHTRTTSIVYSGNKEQTPEPGEFTIYPYCKLESGNPDEAIGKAKKTIESNVKALVDNAQKVHGGPMSLIDHIRLFSVIMAHRRIAGEEYVFPWEYMHLIEAAHKAKESILVLPCIVKLVRQIGCGEPDCVQK